MYVRTRDVRDLFATCGKPHNTVTQSKSVDKWPIMKCRILHYEQCVQAVVLQATATATATATTVAAAHIARLLANAVAAGTVI